jgi:Domain of unknown function (DUF4276)
VKRLYVVVEGFSEEAFVRARLRPHLIDLGVLVAPIVVTTARDRSGHKHKGGGRWAHWRNDIERVYREQAGPDAVVTTMFDLYGLPADFPELVEIRRAPTVTQKLATAEQALAHAIHRFAEGRWFIPYVQQHEFEALVLACLDDLGRMLDSPDDLQGLAALSADIGEMLPEDVNDGPSTAPSKRLMGYLPGYDKVTYSEYALCEVSLSVLAERCQHFGQWLKRLETIATAPAT